MGFSGSLGEKRKTIIGTMMNMAPEILNYEGYDEKSDIWSIGCLTCQLFTGQSPFNVGSNNIDKIISKIN